MAPQRVIYAGSASKTLAPGLRIGWLVVPYDLLDAVTREKRLADLSTAHTIQYAFADFIAKGYLDRHLRRMRKLYEKRRSALVGALQEFIPEASVGGVSAGLHAAVRLPDGHDEREVAAKAVERGIALGTLNRFRMRKHGPATLLLGYSQTPESTIVTGIRELAAAIAPSRTRTAAVPASEFEPGQAGRLG
ncbi:MAG: aminotransferase class I/II-fold pyridoxal phosphate-dependent enzyme [Acidimicrobiia bacterium]|nr:aminotransferase class I/II-fold pyridoxal phosphate-dependent enzyme [Acidimicrobiia bacterium]